MASFSESIWYVYMFYLKNKCSRPRRGLIFFFLQMEQRAIQLKYIYFALADMSIFFLQ